jgi:hypothetical protein
MYRSQKDSLTSLQALHSPADGYYNSIAHWKEDTWSSKRSMWSSDMWNAQKVRRRGVQVENAHSDDTNWFRGINVPSLQHVDIVCHELEVTVRSRLVTSPKLWVDGLPPHRWGLRTGHKSRWDRIKWAIHWQVSLNSGVNHYIGMTMLDVSRDHQNLQKGFLQTNRTRTFVYMVPRENLCHT